MDDNHDDEGAFYRDIQLFDAQFEEAIWPELRITHATHVLDTAAGSDRDFHLADEFGGPSSRSSCPMTWWPTAPATRSAPTFLMASDISPTA